MLLWGVPHRRAAVATLSKGRYPYYVRYSLQRWSIVVLLIMRLILGEFAHAMPHPSERADPDSAGAAQQQEQPCPDHADMSNVARPSAESMDVTAEVHTGGASHGHDVDCCKTTCNCPCLHISAIETPALVMNLVILGQRSIPFAAIGHLPDRISLLFRPPA